MTRFFLRAAFAALGLWVAAHWVGGILITDSKTLIASAVLLGIINAIVRPIAPREPTLDEIFGDYWARYKINSRKVKDAKGDE